MTTSDIDQETHAFAAAMCAALSDDIELGRLTREGERLSHAHGRQNRGELSASEERSLRHGSRVFLDRIATVFAR